MAPFKPDPVILIHGAWAGSFVWDRFAALLRDAGFEAVAIDLPGNGADATPPQAVSLELYARHVVAAVHRAGPPATLIAHSGGGMVAAQAAELAPEMVARLVFVAGFMLPDGVGFADIVADILPQHPEAAGINPFLQRSADGATTVVPADAAAAIFFSDCPPDVARAAAARLTPQPEAGRAVAPRLTAARIGAVPRLYVEATEDRSVVLAAQRRMQALVPGAAVVSLATGHAPQVSSPAALLASILPFLEGKPPGESGSGS
jgi:pimeloyl-ACP methyl ester carboxylesterase